MMFNKLVNILVLYAVFQISACSNCAVKLIIITPNHHTGTPSASWERGEEILPQIEDAVKSINDCEHILPNCKLTIATSSEQCDRENFIDLENVIN